MRWLSRTDQARRTKGEPAPTYQELEATVAELARKLAEAVAANKGLTDRNERLARQLEAMRERLPVLVQANPAVGYAISEEAVAAELSADPDPTRPYIPTYEAGEGER